MKNRLLYLSEVVNIICQEQLWSNRCQWNKNICSQEQQNVINHLICILFYLFQFIYKEIKQTIFIIKQNQFIIQFIKAKLNVDFIIISKQGVITIIQMIQSQRPLLDPYRTLGCLVSGKINISDSQPISLAVPTMNSFKIYSDTLAIKVVSPPLQAQVKSVICFNQYSYVHVADKVLQMKYHHIVKQWKLSQKQNSQKSLSKAFMLKFQSIILIALNETVSIIDTQTDEIQTIQVGFKIKGIVHPVTYINKIIVYNETCFQLINPVSKKILYDYPNLQSYLKENVSNIKVVQSSKLVNIVAIGLLNGQILIYNIKKDELVFKVKLILSPICISFYDEKALMATSDIQGNVVLWDLEKKKIIYKFQQFIEGPIDSLLFMPGQPLITCASSQKNCIKQLRINLQDSRILTLYRQRMGITQPVINFQIANDTELILSSSNQSLFTSMYSHSNSYVLSKVLDSSLPYHIVARHFQVLLYKNQTMEKSFNIHQSAVIGKISLSQKYYIIATKSRLIKLGVTGVECKISGTKQISLYNEHYIFAATDADFFVLDFSTFQVVKQLSLNSCTNLKTNMYRNLLSFYNGGNHAIQIWNMQKVEQARVFEIDQNDKPRSICFTSDNRFLLSTHDKKLHIWSILDNNLYKTYLLQNTISCIAVTPDNQFILSSFQGQKQICIWNNYIGKITTNRQQEILQFKVKITYCLQDFRKQLKLQSQIEMANESNSQQFDILDTLPDAIDGVAQYKFQQISKWLPLIYYDQIKERNTPQNANTNSLPFFLDFKNIDEEKKKIQKQIKSEIIQKKKEKQNQIDKNLENQTHQIQINQQSNHQNYISCIKTLRKLSVAEIDYQLRKYLLNPANKYHLLKMFQIIFKQFGKKQQQFMDKVQLQFLNILFHRLLYLIGNEIFQTDMKQTLKEIEDSYQVCYRMQKEKVDRCVAFIERMV